MHNPIHHLTPAQEDRAVQRLLRKVNAAAKRVFVAFTPSVKNCKHERVVWSDARKQPFRVHNRSMEMIG